MKKKELMTIVDDVEFDENKHKLGKICKWGHEWRGSGKSIRLKSAGDCLGCNRVYKKETKQKIAEQRQQQPNILIEHFDFSSGLYTLGYLCPTRHNYQGSNQSVRLFSNDHCYYCRKDYYAKTADHQRAKSNAYRKANRERVLARLREYFSRPEIAIKKQAYQKEYYYKHKEHLLEWNREYRKKNRIKINATAKRWRQTLAGAASSRASRRRREERMKKARLIPYSGKQLAQRYELFGNCCAYCGSLNDLTDDHVIAIAVGGYDCPENIVPACRSCNSSKQEFLIFNWYKKQPFFDVERLLNVFDSLGEYEKERLTKELRIREGVKLNSFVVTE